MNQNDWLSQFERKSEQTQSIPLQAQEDQTEPIQKPQNDWLAQYERPKLSEKKTKKSPGLAGQFTEGLDRSVTGKILGSREKKPDQDSTNPGFWQSLVEESGTFIGDSPFFVAGGTLGASIGSVGGPLGALVGGGAGAMALPAFLKTSINEYQKFQDKGGDLTFGQFLESADKVASNTLKEGAFGAILGVVGKSVPLLRKIPGVGTLFDTKYVGKGVEKALEIGAEAATAASIPAVTEGRLPTGEDIAKAAVLITGTKATGIPGDLWKSYNTIKPTAFNYALANGIKAENLAYPPLQELNLKASKAYKNSQALDKNLAQFSESYVSSLKNKIEDISPQNFQSAHEAGMSIRQQLSGFTFDTQPPPEQIFASKISEKPPEVQPVEPRPVVEEIPKPKPIETPIINNPLGQGINTISRRRFTSDADVGRNIRNQYRDNRAESKAPLDDRYENLDTQLAQVVVTDPLLPVRIEDFIGEFGQSAAPNSPEAIVAEQARRLLNLVAEVREGVVVGPREVNLERLSKTNRSIKSRPNWEIPSDYRQNLNELTTQVDEFITNTLNQYHPALGQEYGQLNRDYRAFKNRYDNDVMKIFWDRTETSESIYNRFTKLDDFNQLTQALGTNQYGSDLLNDIRAEVWRKNVGEKALNARTESEFTKAIGSLTDRDFSNLMEFLTPEQRNVMNNRVRLVNDIRRSVETSAREFERSKELYEVAKRERSRAGKIELEQAKTAEQKKKAQEKAVKERAAADEEVKKQFEAQQKAQKEYQTQLARLRSKSTQNLGANIQAKQDLLVSILKEDPAQIMANMDSIEGVQRMKQAMKDIPGGQDLYNAAARFETERMFDFIRENYIDTQTVPFKGIKKAMTNKEFRAKLLELNGDKWVSSLDSLVEISEQLSDSYKDLRIKYRDDPGTLESMANIATMLGVVHGELIIPSTIQATKYAAKQTHSWWVDKRNYSQEHIKAAIEAAEAMKSGSPKRIRRASDVVMRLFGNQYEEEKDKKSNSVPDNTK